MGPGAETRPVRSPGASAYDQYKANFEIAKANVAVAQAGVAQAKASLAQAQAALDRAQRNLSYCTIKSPVKGVIINRRVNTGQTVVSSLNAPSLFLIAKDLTRIQVWVSVNEADIGNIHPGMAVTFTVDAFPNQCSSWPGRKVRLNATMTQNVVNYTVEVTTDNSDGKLLPYLTANAQFVTGSRENGLLAPNAALRWQPATAQSAESKVQSPKSKVESPEVKQNARGGNSKTDGQAQGTIWVMDGESAQTRQSQRWA